MSNLKLKDNEGFARSWAVETIILVVLGVITTAGMMKTRERAEDIMPDGSRIRYDLCLPHVDEDLDQYHFVVDPYCKPSLRTTLNFCPTGLEPPWSEGQHLDYIRVMIEPKCLRLLGYSSSDRDASGDIINR